MLSLRSILRSARNEEARQSKKQGAGGCLAERTTSGFSRPLLGSAQCSGIATARNTLCRSKTVQSAGWAFEIPSEIELALRTTRMVPQGLAQVLRQGDMYAKASGALVVLSMLALGAGKSPVRCMDDKDIRASAPSCVSVRGQMPCEDVSPNHFDAVAIEAVTPSRTKAMATAAAVAAASAHRRWLEADYTRAFAEWGYYTQYMCGAHADTQASLSYEATLATTSAEDSQNALQLGLHEMQQEPSLNHEAVAHECSAGWQNYYSWNADASGKQESFPSSNGSATSTFEPTPCYKSVRVAMSGVPNGLCSRKCVEAILEQAGMQDFVINFTVQRGRASGEVKAVLYTWESAHLFVSHFAGCHWGANTDQLSVTMELNSDDDVVSKPSAESSQVDAFECNQNTAKGLNWADCSDTDNELGLAAASVYHAPEDWDASDRKHAWANWADCTDTEDDNENNDEDSESVSDDR